MNKQTILCPKIGKFIYFSPKIKIFCATIMVVVFFCHINQTTDVHFSAFAYNNKIHTLSNINH